MIRFITLFIIFTDICWSVTQCKLPRSETIKIGCAYDCGFSNIWRMKTSAMKLGYKVSFTNLVESKSSNPLQEIDALLVPGGEDINPNYYETSLPTVFVDIINRFRSFYRYSINGRKRDEYEFDLIKNYFNSDTKKPLLGICRGMQMMSVTQGVPLYLDLKAELGIENRDHVWDEISIVKDSLMDKIFPKNSFYGFENHHQGPRMDYWKDYSQNHPTIRYTSFSNGGKVAEAMEVPGRPILGVQFHPEKSMPRVKHKIFGWFLKEACKAKKDQLEKGQL